MSFCRRQGLASRLCAARCERPAAANKLAATLAPALLEPLPSLRCSASSSLDANPVMDHVAFLAFAGSR